MTRSAAQSLAAALAAFIAVTPLVARHDEARPAGGAGAHHLALSASPHSGLAGVGMPDTGPGNVPPKPLTVIVNVTGTTLTRELRAEVDQLGSWLSTHHGRARMALVRGGRATGLVEPSTIERAPVSRLVRSLSTFTRTTFAAHPGQRLLVTIGARRPATLTGAASLWLPARRGASVVDTVDVHDHQAVEQPVDVRRRGAVAATAARAVISLAHLNEVRP